ncbi:MULTISPECIES: transposase [Mycetohabitans]|uniref:transposase n=1 Tax=Mycetohabitans TaxID=2571159 RepID=UPI001F162CAC|nr:transposase [Mycetohabitans sp. B3]MCF2134308.1 transposase [Mycetohabitans sp. B3]
MSRYTEQQKLQVVEDYLSGRSGLKTVAKRHDVDISAVCSWVAAYREHGCAGLMKKQRVDYSAEFKLAVLKRMRSEGLSCRQVAAKFDIRLFKIVDEWEHRYDEGGLEALSPRCRGLPKKMPTTVNFADLPVKAVQREARTQDELLAEVKQLRMKNCSGLMKPDTDLGENARHEEVSDEEAATYVFPGIQTASRLSGARAGL